MTQQPELFYEDVYDALRAAVQACGGAKEVGPKLWPSKPPLQARNALLDCLNRNNERKLDPEETFRIFRIAREMGFHAGFHYACDFIGYHKPAAVSPKEEADGILERAAELASASRAVATQLERLHASGVLKAIPGKSAMG